MPSMQTHHCRRAPGPLQGVGRPLSTRARPVDACRQAIVKPKFRQALVDLIKEAGAASGCPKAQGALLYTTASKVGRIGKG